MEDVVALEEAEGWCSQYESVLRNSFGEERKLPEEWEAMLKKYPPTTVRRAITRFALLKHFTLLRQAGSSGGAQTPEREEAREAARQLLTREPVRVRLGNGRSVKVTSRSLSAMVQISAHESRIRMLQVELDHVADLFRVTRGQAGSSPWRERGRLRRRLRRIQDLHHRLFQEMYLHRERLYAHAFTETGAGAKDDEPAPSWWTETTATDDARLLAALYEAGPLRYAKLGDPPRRNEKGRSGAENFGYEGLLVSWGIRKKIPPAAMMDQDLAQALTEMRAAAPPSLEETADG